jgi:hypothetical protein
MSNNPVIVRARRELPLNRWLWLVKWLLLIPHYIVLCFLWLAFVILTLIAYIAVLFTGRYPKGMHTFNVGVLRWAWRVDYYGYNVLGTDRYPPFTLTEVSEYPAGLNVDFPERLPRWRPLISWLLAIPHFMIIGAFAGTATWTVYQSASGNTIIQLPGGLIPILILFAVITLLFTRRYPQGLYDLLVGFNRWVFRVVAYVGLLTKAYPPFRLDQGDQALTDTDHPA